MENNVISVELNVDGESIPIKNTTCCFFEGEEMAICSDSKASCNFKDSRRLEQAEIKE